MQNEKKTLDTHSTVYRSKGFQLLLFHDFSKVIKREQKLEKKMW